MNIFVLDRDPIQAAEFCCDKHILKMVIESTQILSSVHRLCDNVDQIDGIPLYKLTHKNHPCVKWAKESLSNYRWLCLHALSLCIEYEKRYYKRHACEKLIIVFSYNTPKNLHWHGLTEFVQCMPEQYKIKDDAVSAYRHYYKAEKSRFAKYKLGNTPWFMI